jgi:hypothetical protein
MITNNKKHLTWHLTLSAFIFFGSGAIARGILLYANLPPETPSMIVGLVAAVPFFWWLHWSRWRYLGSLEVADTVMYKSY